MGIGLRIFFIDQDDSLKRLPLRRYERLLNRAPEESLPQYANKRVRYILPAAVSLMNRKPIEIIRLQCSYLSFDSEGKLEVSEFDRAAKLVTQAVPPVVFDRQERQVINAQHRFAKKRFEHEYTWAPTPEIKAVILNAIFGTS